MHVNARDPVVSESREAGYSVDLIQKLSSPNTL